MKFDDINIFWFLDVSEDFVEDMVRDLLDICSIVCFCY